MADGGSRRAEDEAAEVGGYMTEDRDQKSEVGEKKKGGGRGADIGRPEVSWSGAETA